jgi:hypothetical protein
MECVHGQPTWDRGCKMKTRKRKQNKRLTIPRAVEVTCEGKPAFDFPIEHPALRAAVKLLASSMHTTGDEAARWTAAVLTHTLPSTDDFLPGIMKQLRTQKGLVEEISIEGVSPELLANLDSIAQAHEQKEISTWDGNCNTRHALLWRIVELINRCLEDNRPADDPLRLRFGAVMHMDDVTPTMETLRELIGEFHTLPADEQRDIMNGWSMPKTVFDYADLQNDLRCLSTAVPVVEICPDDKSILATCNFIYSPLTFPVVVTIRRGSSRDEVLKAIVDADKYVRANWRHIVVMEPEQAE